MNRINDSRKLAYYTSTDKNANIEIKYSFEIGDTVYFVNRNKIYSGIIKSFDGRIRYGKESRTK